MKLSRKLQYTYIAVALLIMGGVSLIVITRKSHPAPSTSSAEAILPITVTTVASGVPGFATFQSHNEKVLQNQYGIFITYLASTDASDNSVWRLARSTDGGVNFTTVYQATVATRAPPIASTSNGSIYLAYIDYVGTHQGYILRFDPESNFQAPTQLATLPPSIANGKFAMVVDEARQQLYFANSTGDYGMQFFTVGFNGAIKQNTKLLKEGPNAGSHYPNLYLDEFGDLYIAWTTVPTPNNTATTVTYYSIAVLRSTDGGLTWLGGGSSPVTAPVISDDTGPAVKISVPADGDVWLANFIVKNHVGHFMYDLSNYVRYNFSTGQTEDRNTSAFSGPGVTFYILDGMFASKRSDPSAPLYAISRTYQNQIGVRISADQGKTWRDFAQSDVIVNYAIGGSREITTDNKLIGTFTEIVPDGTYKVRFFSVPLTPIVAPPPEAPTISNITPTSGSIGTTITLTGSQFALTGNVVNFGNSYIPNISSNGTTLSFTVPQFITQACNFANPPCPSVATPTPLGAANVTVSNQNGTSNSLNFTVTSITPPPPNPPPPAPNPPPPPSNTPPPPTSTNTTLTLKNIAPTTTTGGQQFNYTLTLNNTGSTTAKNVLVRTQLKSALNFVSASGASCQYTNNAGEVRCTISSLPAQGQSIITIVVKAVNCGTVSNYAYAEADNAVSVSSDEVDTTIACTSTPPPPAPNPPPAPTPVPPPSFTPPPPTYTTPSVVLPANVREANILKFSGNPTVYLVQTDGLHPFDSFISYQNYVQTSSEKLRTYKQSVTPYTVQSTSASQVLQSTNASIPLGSDFKYPGNPTIYWLNNKGQKEAYPSLSVFNAWHGDLKKVITIRSEQTFPDGGIVRMP